MKQAALLTIEKAYKVAPPELQYLKRQSLTNFHKYCADLYLQHNAEISAVRQAQQHLWSAIRLRPQTLLNKRTQELVFKSLLKRVLPVGFISYISHLKHKYKGRQDSKFPLSKIH